MTHILKLGVLAAAMLVCLGSGCSKPQQEADIESKKLNQDPDYAKQMQGKMGGASPSK